MKRTIFLYSAMLFLLGLCLPISANAQLHHRNQDLPCVNKNYNLIAHVAVDSTNREPLYSEVALEEMVEKLNEIFSPICISFSLCDFNVLENDYALGRVRGEPISKEQQLEELKSRFSLRRRINIFFLDFVFNELCGTSTFEGILTLNDANIFTEQVCRGNGSGIALEVAHHLGHIFGLRNTYDVNTIELVDGSNCATAGDRICDTPADPFGQDERTPEEQILIDNGELQEAFISSSCEFIYEIKDPNGDYYNPDMGNIMTAYPCKCGFTQDQFRKMVETILRSDIEHF